MKNKQKTIMPAGSKFGNLTLVSYISSGKWLCKCDCGNETTASLHALKHGRHISCGCSKLTLKPGDKFGKLTVVRYEPVGKKWLCVCDCGNKTYARSWSLKTYRHSSCSCGRYAERLRARLPDNLSLKREMLKNYRKSAIKRGYTFSLSEKQFFALITSNCHYCGADPVIDNNAKNRGRSFKHNGVDRIDNSVGYTATNCVACCSICNMSKRCLTLEEWRAWLDKAYKHQHK